MSDSGKKEHRGVQSGGKKPETRSSALSKSTPSAPREKRISSVDQDETSDIENVKSVLESIQETLKNIVTKDDIRDIVKSVVAEFKDEIKKEIQQELKSAIKEDILKEVKMEVSEELEKQKQQHNGEVSKVRQQLADKVDGLVMDNETNMDNIGKVKNWLSRLDNQMKEINRLANTAISMGNFNQQYSQKNNVKILNWPEHQGQKLKEEFCKIVEEKTGVVLDQRDVLAIHRIPSSNKRHPRPVIVKFLSNDIRKAVITKREKLKSTFTMVDHLTNMNAQLLKRLRAEEREHVIDSAWYFNGYIFAMDKSGKRHKLDVSDDIDKKIH